MEPCSGIVAIFAVLLATWAIVTVTAPLRRQVQQPQLSGALLAERHLKLIAETSRCPVCGTGLHVDVEKSRLPQEQHLFCAKQVCAAKFVIVTTGETKIGYRV